MSISVLIQRARRAIARGIAGKQTCYGCRHLKGYYCAQLYYLDHTWSSKIDVAIADNPGHRQDSVLINSPEDFGCNHWTEKE